MAKKHLRDFAAYYCNWCDLYHVGNDKHDGCNAVVVRAPTRREIEREEAIINGFNTIGAAWPQELRDKLNERLQHN